MIRTEENDRSGDRRAAGGESEGGNEKGGRRGCAASRSGYVGRAVSASAVLVLVAGLTGGCGYSLGGYRAPERVRTVAIPMFDNATFPLRRGVEYEVTSALRRELLARTGLEIASSDRADLVIYGTVSEYTESVVAEGRLDEKLESTLRISVELVVENYVAGTQERARVRDIEPISVARGETVADAEKRAIVNLAEKILLQLEAW